jgi:hypothetical protein
MVWVGNPHPTLPTRHLSIRSGCPPATTSTLQTLPGRDDWRLQVISTANAV